MISVVIPVYRNAENIPSLLEALQQLDQDLDGDLEVVFVVDGSPDDSALRLSTELPTLGMRAQLLTLSRNFGSFEAIRAGLEAGRGDYFAVMAADLQEPPSLMASFHQRLRSGECDITIGQRATRDDPALRRLMSTAFWAFYRRFVVPDVPPGGLDVFGCTRAVRDQILRLRERNSSLVGLLLWVGFRREYVRYERRAREIGESAWSLRKRLAYLMDSVFSFSALPIQILLRLGTLGLGVSAVFSLVVIATKLFSEIPVPGYAATVLVVTFFGALNCFGLGVVGQYVWRTFENTKARPGHIVASREEFEPSTN
ncbi:MAG: glycosyltransferase family 2 protein [Myxococcota bacterium]|nr:glycosyltransferase family 2 protein [Myxococcota bacterium]